MSATDYLRLNEHKIFKELCESLPKNLTKTLNVLTVHDNVLFTWDFQNSCVLSLNIKAVRRKEGDNIIHQKLLPIYPPLFTPEFLITNDVGTLLAVAGPNGVLVLQLPQRCPPYGAFDNNKEVVYCRSHTLDERLLSCNETVEVRQVKFHPGSTNYNHIMVLTSDNTLRLYHIENNEARNIATYPVGEKPMNMFPGSKTPFLDIYGEIAVDFDFGHPEISAVSPLNVVYDYESTNKALTRSARNSEAETLLINAQTQTSDKIIPREPSIKNKKEINRKKWESLVWPIYILRGDGTIYSINIDLSKRSKVPLTGPLPLSSFDVDQGEACSLVCLNTTPQILCMALSNGTLCHSILLDIEEDTYQQMKENAKVASEVPSKEIIAFESVELELGLTTSDDEVEVKYRCPIFLQKDESKPGRYYATHSAGVHCITISCAEELQSFASACGEIEPTSDLFTRPSKAEYLVCTKTDMSEKVNPVIGFSPYYEPTSIITLLSDGSLVTLGMLYSIELPKIEDLAISDDQAVNSPLNKMLKEPFDQYIQKILKRAPTQPVLKLPVSSNHSQEHCYELLQRASQVLRDDYFKHHTKAREELEKRVQTLTMMKNNQQKEIERMILERDALQDRASNLAEKYEDIKDRQDELLKKCENLLMLVSRKKVEPSDAEKAFMEDLKNANEKVLQYGNKIDSIKKEMKYQQVQMEDWKAQEVKKVSIINETHANTIKTNLQESTKKITDMIKEVTIYKNSLNL